MNEALMARIAREAGVPDLLEILAERLEPTDLQSLLLEAYARRAAAVSPARLLEQFETNRFVRPSAADARDITEIERLAWRLLPDGYMPIELAPLCPLGTNSAVATVSQHKIVSAIRNTEAVADSTNVLALECAVRRRQARQSSATRGQSVLLAASQRVTRAQAFGGPGLSAHFRLVSLCAAGRDEGAYRFESRQLVEQIAFCVRLIQEAATVGAGLRPIRVAITDFTDGVLGGALEERVLGPLSAQLPHVRVHFDPERTAGRGYYDGVCFKVLAVGADGVELELGDGGVTAWTQRLLSDAKERLVIAGVGVDRLCRARR
jgi:hypothetical protein